MDFSEGNIYIDHGRTDNAATTMVEQSKAVEGYLAQLEMDLTALKNSWIGDDKDVYQQVQANWNQAMENIRLLLSSNSDLLIDISDNYRYTAQNLAQRWSGITIGGR